MPEYRGKKARDFFKHTLFRSHWREIETVVNHKIPDPNTQIEDMDEESIRDIISAVKSTLMITKGMDVANNYEKKMNRELEKLKEEVRLGVSSLKIPPSVILEALKKPYGRTVENNWKRKEKTPIEDSIEEITRRVLPEGEIKDMHLSRLADELFNHFEAHGVLPPSMSRQEDKRLFLNRLREIIGK
ncbi:MAG: hypothetical protein J7K68_00065 [Candidatus Diapherotrites archaeon]|nr:hypothetical protein [Candidatus Diapherotrites archaeon]